MGAFTQTVINENGPSTASVTVANPLPVSGADGIFVTLGAKADAKNTATDSTAVTVMQVLKEISFVLQNGGGAVTTIDGGSVTLGAKADAKSTATDTTAITIMQVLKEISAMEQAPATRAVTNTGTFATQSAITAASTALADGSMVTLGTKADAKSTATDTTSITVMSVLKQISASVQAPPSQAVTNVGTFAVQDAALAVAQNSTTSGQSGTLVQCATTTSAPTNTTAKTNPFSCGTDGGLRVSAPADTVNTTPPTYANADPISHLEYALNGQPIFMPYQNPAYFVNGTTAAITDTTSTSVIASAGGSLRNYITQCTVSNSHATVGTFVKILDGSTIINEGYAAAVGGGYTATFPTPLRGTAATAVNAQPVTTGSNVIVSCSGFKGL